MQQACLPMAVMSHHPACQGLGSARFVFASLRQVIHYCVLRSRGTCRHQHTFQPAAYCLVYWYQNYWWRLAGQQSNQCLVPLHSFGMPNIRPVDWYAKPSRLWIWHEFWYVVLLVYFGLPIPIPKRGPNACQHSAKGCTRCTLLAYQSLKPTGIGIHWRNAKPPLILVVIYRVTNTEKNEISGMRRQVPECHVKHSQLDCWWPSRHPSGSNDSRLKMRMPQATPCGDP